MPVPETPDRGRHRISRRLTLSATLCLATIGTVTFSTASPAARSVEAGGSLVVEQRKSRLRGRNVELVYLLPRRTPPRGMPMVVLLHGRHSRARLAAPGGLVPALARAVDGGRVPPFGFVAVDGGNTYWHEHHHGDDPMGMLLEEVPEWLRSHDLGGDDGTPFAAAGTSMGGFGALLYARRRAERQTPVRAVAALAPALMPWREMRRRRAWHSRADWASMDPLRHVHTLRGTPTGIWCGTEDPFIDGARSYIRRADPEVAHLAPGGHTGEFFSSTVPGLLAFLARHCPEQVWQRS
ncbi:alpha/beta hydrolase [Saccharomonospora piscinae]|uniref:Alpha/beta hydrolase n=1 Tax=Saccharomonospora piscinae TaxID=687388 RepID=A0A1V8ZXI9_SACPI|nr:alpha/beta hydrolase [Saccharomonospora piscinae]TLW91173.1 alpha/beta hydrolase [Saccharomonospora piscinae]